MVFQIVNYLAFTRTMFCFGQCQIFACELQRTFSDVVYWFFNLSLAILLRNRCFQLTLCFEIDIVILGLSVFFNSVS